MDITDQAPSARATFAASGVAAWADEQPTPTIEQPRGAVTEDDDTPEVAR